MDNTWYIEGGASLPNGYFKRNEFMVAADINDFRFKYENKGVYHTAYMYDKDTHEGARLKGDFYLDFDSDLLGSFDKIKKDIVVSIKYLTRFLKIDKSNIYIFFSGSKGFHLTVPFETLGLDPDEYLNRYYKMLALDIDTWAKNKTIDLKIYDNRRLFRMANSIHQKTNLYKIYLTHEEFDSLSLEQIKEKAKSPVLIKRNEVKVSQEAKRVMQSYKNTFIDYLNKKRDRGNMDLEGFDFIPPCVEKLLENGASEGSRNDTAAFLTGFFKQQKNSLEDTTEKMIEWNDKKCGLPERELLATVRSIYRGTGKAGCQSAKILSECSPDCKLRKGRGKYE